jgi:hypothetical protein
MLLGDFLERSGGERWPRDRRCPTLFAAHWARLSTGRDPLAPWRELYTDAASEERIIAAAGGYLALVRQALEGIGWQPVDVPDDGDIGVLEGVLAMSEAGPVQGQVAAIRCGSFWIVRALAGIRGIDIAQLAAWRAPPEAFGA